MLARTDHSQRYRKQGEYILTAENVHSLVDLVDREVAMNLRHGSARLLHRVQSLLVDICRFDRVDLLL